jgi:hypothetical protein
VAFRTGAAFINLDGLINGFEYQAALRRGELGRYLKQAGAHYLVVDAWETGPVGGPVEPMYAHRIDAALYRGDYTTYKFFVYCYMYGCCSDTIALSRAQEVWRSASEMDGSIPARTVIFDLIGHAP